MLDSLNLPAIAFFSATGFFPGESTYFKNKVFQYQESSSFANDYNKFAKFKWYYKPDNINIHEATEQFASVFEKIIKRQTTSQHVILPLSGGLDSRTQAVALKRLGIPTRAFSYSYQNGHNENTYGKSIAQKCGFNFNFYNIPEGYLWNCIYELARINQCYTDLTLPRQMAFVDEFSKLGDLFSLGHWGDVLFDGMNVKENINFDEQVNVIAKKITRKGGEQLANTLWKEWDLDGNFNDYFYSTVADLHKQVYIAENANSSVRAFKSKYWATRWTASNFSVFEKYNPITLPYYDVEMCDFICRVPESMLNQRQIQIEYIKKYAPELAKVKWQAHKPFNLYNYRLNKSPFNIPYRMIGKATRVVNELTGKPLVQRNWELQFLGKNNKTHLNKTFTNNKSFNHIISPTFIQQVIASFYNKPSPATAHQVGMLLTLSVFSKLHLK